VKCAFPRFIQQAISAFLSITAVDRNPYLLNLIIWHILYILHERLHSQTIIFRSYLMAVYFVGLTQPSRRTKLFSVLKATKDEILYAYVRLHMTFYFYLRLARIVTCRHISAAIPITTFHNTATRRCHTIPYAQTGMTKLIVAIRNYCLTWLSSHWYFPETSTSLKLFYIKIDIRINSKCLSFHFRTPYGSFT
jgi:hypothetical protein